MYTHWGILVSILQHTLLSAHEAEIEYARAMVTKTLGSGENDYYRSHKLEVKFSSGGIKLASSFLLITVACPFLFLTDQAPNWDIPGQNAIEDQNRLEQYQFRSLITRISVITKRRIVIAFRMYSFEILLFPAEERERNTPLELGSLNLLFVF